MDGSSEGTPNPLNPAPDTASGAAVKPASFAQATNEAAPVGAPTSAPASAGATSASAASAPTQSAMPEMSKAAPTSAMPEMRSAPRPAAPANHGVVDPMMRPVAHHNTASAPADDGGNFDTLGIDNVTLDDLRQTNTTPGDTGAAYNEPAFVAKDSVVEGKGKKSKKPWIIGAIVLLMIAIICGAAAVAIAVMGNSGDKVGKAIDKLLNGQMSNIISVQGNISTSVNGDAEMESTYGLSATSTSISVDGTFDTSTWMNKVNATIDVEFPKGAEAKISVNEIHNKSGDTFVKVSGLSDMLTSLTSGLITVDAETIDVVDGDEEETAETSEAVLTTNCADGTNCASEITDLTTTSGLMSIYSGVFDAIEDEWILISDDYGDAVSSINLFDNSSTCLIDAFQKLPEYAKDLANKYKANPFITYSTDNLAISKKKNDLYRLGFDNDKLAAFVNSMSNSGFVNEIFACYGATATNSKVSADAISSVLSNLPAMYVEIDNDNNFTRVYFKLETTEDDVTSTSVADLNLSYPSELKITEPSDYVQMSTLLTNLMTGLLPANANSTSE